ncbi:hypothetical protein HJC23_008268 [Cyclotella cryptica]|uniref:Uncharacterized protein n=1 Tax=Cyclotella cryptica TaxID=29204 RepID=A0ABD3NXS0_9STRA
MMNPLHQSPIQTPPRVKDPPEAALTPVQAGLTPAHDNHLPLPLPTTTTPMMPLPPPLDDAPQTQDLSNSQQDNSKKKRSRLAYVNKGILASQELFLDSDEDIALCKDETYLVGKVLSAPRKGVTDEFTLHWDRAALSSSLANIKLRRTVHKDDTEQVGRLNNPQLNQKPKTTTNLMKMQMCIPLKSDNLIFRLEEFRGLTCFEIAHHPDAKDLCKCNLNQKKFLTQMGHQTNNTKETIPRAYNVQTSHPLYIKLREVYRPQSIQHAKGVGKTTGLSDEESDEE